jgi:tetratricopeptide (TPR) repeat protein
VATEYYEKAIEISQAANMATAQSRWLGQLGICHLMLNNVSQAIDCLVQAVSSDERQGDIEQQSMHLEMLGHCYRTKYEPAEAMKYYQKVLELDNQRGHSQRQDTHQRNLDICHNLINNIPMETIIYPEDVSDNLDLKNYFWQRFGPDFDELPYILLDRDEYLSLLHGENALLSEMLIEDEEAANEIFFAFASDKLNRVIMTFHIESPDVGNRAVAFIEARKRTKLHETWFQEMKQLAQAMQKLHREWQQQGIRYYEVGVVRRFKPPL